MLNPASRSIMQSIMLCFMIFAISLNSRSQEAGEEYYFYHGREYGTDAIYTPFAAIINGGFGILQYGNLSREVLSLNYAQGWRNVRENLSHPFHSIDQYGWSNFLGNEFYPKDINKKNGQFWPNYQNHLIGGGMDYIEAMEWYRFHGYPQPRLLAIGTMVVYHFTNEVIENGEYDGINVDPIADLYFFDPLGIILFSIDSVPEFFSKTLNMASWPLQPAFSPNTRTLENQGQNYSIKYRPPFSQKVSIFYYWGLTGLLGLSYTNDSRENFSLGAGLRAKELYDTDGQNAGRKLTASLTWNVGFFFDRENSLLSSIIFSGVSDYKVHANIYPGMIQWEGFSSGFFAAFGESGRVVVGMNLRYFPIGLAARISR